MDKRLLTIQDISCVGQCSLTVALPVISACGIETAVLPSSVLSNHTAFKSWTFNDLTDDMENILNQWKKENITFSAFYTGYVSEAQIPIIKKIIRNDEIVSIIIDQKKLPIKQITELCHITVKKVEPYRKYIIGIVMLISRFI